MAIHRHPLLGKALALCAVLVALMLALEAVGNIVHEREARLHDAERNVADSLAAQQTLLGPVLISHCTELWTSDQGEGKDRTLVAQKREFVLGAVPQSLVVHAKATTETRYRGIFRVNGYAMAARLEARWTDAMPALTPTPEHAGSTLHCDAPSLLLAVGDARGIRSASVTVDGAALAVLPGTGQAGHPQGFHAVLPMAFAEAARREGRDAPARSIAADVTLDLVGTGELGFAPVAEATVVSLASDWPHPSFTGRFLPASRTIGERGFDASWQLSALATSAPQQWLEGGAVCGLGAGDAPPAPAVGGRCIDSFGVTFFDPVSVYTLSDRATKYGLLFIALTFVGVGLVEVLRRLRVHPVQYLLVGSAIAMFFLLLVSLTEHISFAWAYLAGASACTALLTFYGSFVLHGWRPGTAFGAGIAALYGALYLLLQMEQNALLLGSLLLFAVLAAVMVATRRVDWYTLTRHLSAGPTTGLAPATE